MEILQTTTFKKQVKKLHKNQKSFLDHAIHDVLANTSIGTMKTGNLSGIRIYKFQIINQLTLLAYKIIQNKLQLILLSFGTHENFYRDLKSDK